ncbi:hypothetical protein SELMODRAFT_447120 [Selaginella moellendorffii]|uniref:U2A'/phosphoprotein 32 family A C-terminal domain-containing protein n=1 Tax=Selaginella moellendorffii TaxID=88036 RepID=D8SWW3_SELML|nr:leucine-rich repeat and guanylate kinase domain-containing protein isoform X1 [Selaginella moellendorffii]XP_024517365.1 leucine-rich repeat and guanylate kinase domain-containing protein isoform X1 [Selaginella moellendorffii]EFJ11161.1 hypothetical protein SELMODRAFT_447120 [Selaginella moellendorffii]|eukprot:XP_002987858.1 leucine-rich repeat and guanylate kinase domain-containing protein isoform X1 [Selaginella moellendorffii]
MAVMRTISCFPVFSSWSSQKKDKKKNNDASLSERRLDLSREVSGKAKVWPGDDASPTIGGSKDPEKQTLATTDLKSSSASVRSLPDPEDCKTPSTSFSSSAEFSPIVIQPSGSDYHPAYGTKDGDEEERYDGSIRSALKHVEDWVRNLEELDEMDKSGEEDPEQDTCAQAATAAEDQSDPDRELNDLVVQSLDPLAGSAHLAGIGLKSLPLLGAFNNLRSLSISGNSIAKIPPGCLPRNLHFLDLSRNKISVIEGLRGLSRLRILNLSHNRISRVGHGLGNCTSVRELYLSGNKISEVEGLHRLRKLFLLDLSNNRLTTAKSLLQLAANYSCLQVLNLLGNAVLLNLGDEQLKRLVGAIAPRLSYLNNLPIKAVPAREAVVGKFARTELVGARKAKRSSGSKAKRVESLQANSSRKSGGRRRRNKHF